jgi:hypothetical protein
MFLLYLCNINFFYWNYVYNIACKIHIYNSVYKIVSVFLIYKRVFWEVFSKDFPTNWQLHRCKMKNKIIVLSKAVEKYYKWYITLLKVHSMHWSANDPKMFTTYPVMLCEALLNPLNYFTWFLEQSSATDDKIICFFQIRKLKFRKVKWMPQVQGH